MDKNTPMSLPRLSVVIIFCFFWIHMIDAIMTNGMMTSLLTIYHSCSCLPHVFAHRPHTTWKTNEHVTEHERTDVMERECKLYQSPERAGIPFIFLLYPLHSASESTFHLDYYARKEWILNANINPVNHIDITHLCHSVRNYLFINANIGRNNQCEEAFTYRRAT